MSKDDWYVILSAMRAQSAATVGHEISDETATEIQQIAGIDIPSERRRFATNLPNVDLAPGLSGAEISATEQRFGFTFPPDLRELLQVALPLGPGFPDWRSGDEIELDDWLDLPRQGLLFDVEHGFWLLEWGTRPEPVQLALRRASDLVAAAPKLIPVYRHRMMPDRPRLAGNPVFSVHQTDIIHYGFDLADYLHSEFHIPGRMPWPDAVRQIDFWDVDRFHSVRWGAGSMVTDPRTFRAGGE